MANRTAKILHISDIQLGMKFPQLGKAGDLVRNAIKEAFERIIKIALDDSVDGMIIAGNLFATNLVSRNLIDFAMKQVERLGRIPLVLVPGDSDALDETSVYKHLKLRRLPANLKILGFDGKNDAEFKDLGFIVSGVPIGSASSQLPTPAETLNMLRILVLPNSTSTQDGGLGLSQLAKDASASGRFDYIAVGGCSGFSRWSDRVVSSGSPEGIDFVAGETGRIVIAEISKSDVNLAFRDVAKLKWLDIDFSSDNYRFTLEVERELQNHADPQTIARARFTGQPARDGFIDLPALYNNFREKFCHFICSDERVVDEQVLQNTQESSSGLVNEFTSLIREGYDQAPPELKKGYLLALSTGRALLSGKDVM